MAHGEEIRITRTWVNSSGKNSLIKDLTDEELKSGIIQLIKSAVIQEWYEKGGPQKYKNSWQSYVERAYWDFCQACFVRGISIEDLINDTSSKIYKQLQEKPPKKELRKKKLGLNSVTWGTGVEWNNAFTEVPVQAEMPEMEDISPFDL